MAVNDTRTVYIAYCEGVNIATNKASYTDPHIIYADVSEPVSYETIEDIGRIPEYDRTLVIEVGEKTKFIREDSRIWIDTTPNDSKDNFDYVIARVGDIKDNQLKLYCNAVAPSTQFLYYCNDMENVFQVKVFYKDFMAIVPKNMYFPITKDTIVWESKPLSAETLEDRIKYVDRVEHERTYSYIFEEE